MTATQRALWSGRPVWLSRTRRLKQRYRSLSGSHHTDVAIVGGGMTGALIAHAFAAAGVATTVLEAGLIGRGSTAASSALLLQEPDLELSQLQSRFGTRASRRIWQAGQESVRDLIALLKRLRITCDLARRDAVYYAADTESAGRLRREFSRRSTSGLEADWLSPGELRRMTGIAAPGAIHSTGSAQFDPYRACVGVVRSAVREGAAVFERSRITRIESSHPAEESRNGVRAGGVRLHTKLGTVDAQRVVIATGYATPEFRPLAGRFRLYRTYVLVTERVRAAERRDLGLTDVMVWDTERPYHYARWTPDHRLVLGGGDRRIVAGQRRGLQFRTAVRELREHFEARLPALAGIRTEFAWDGLFAMTPDSLPYVGSHPRYPGHWFALGYGGNGMTFGMLAARLLLERWQGVTSPDHALFAFNRAYRN